MGVESPRTPYGGPLSFPNQPHAHPTPPSAGDALTATMGHNFVTTSINKVVAWGRERGLIVRLPEKRYCTDNAAMIAFAGLQGSAVPTDPRRVTARSRIA